MCVTVKFLIWLKDIKKFSHKDALSIIKRFNKSKETELDKDLLYEFLNISR